MIYDCGANIYIYIWKMSLRPCVKELLCHVLYKENAFRTVPDFSLFCSQFGFSGQIEFGTTKMKKNKPKQ